MAVSSHQSEFWRELGERHAQDLAQFGYGSIKRRQAFKYFNWNWRWDAIRNSEQLRFLLGASHPATMLRCLLTPAVLASAAWKDAPLARADRWLYTFCVRLLWEYASAQDSAGVLRLAEPELGNPLPVFWKGRLISQDLANSALEVVGISRLLVARRPVNITEIGAGYGRTAFVLLSLFPSCTYTVIDIEPALSISRWYLENLFPKDRLRFVHASDVDTINSGSVSLALSISSLQEMKAEEIDRYLKLMDRIAAGGSVYIKQWTEWYNPSDHFTARFADFPIPKRWQPVFNGICPVQTRFTQAGWTL